MPVCNWVVEKGNGKCYPQMDNTIGICVQKMEIALKEMAVLGYTTK